jgi:penicillin G amidase
VKWLLRTGGALLAVLVLGGAGALWLVRASLPQREGELRLPGLERPVEIVFDARARPFVRAESLGDALFCQGFLHARERLWQMELIRRAGTARLSEALGASLLDTDRELLRSGVPQLAARLEAGAGPAARRYIARYVSGVNAGIASLAAPPPEVLLAGIDVRAWVPRDVFAVGAMMAFDSANNADGELLRWALAQVLSSEELAAFLPDEARNPEFPYVVSPERVAALLERRDAIDPAERPLLPSLSLGSNGWAVAPSRSQSGVALFAFDSHDALSMPNLLYEVHLFFGEGRQVRGWSVAGLPGVVNGFNERLAWGFTNIGDSQDLYLETRDPEDPLRFLGPDGWYEAGVEEVEIPVRGRERPESLRIVHTRLGPLISDDPPISLAWTGHRVGDRGLDALFELNLAGDWREASAALDRLPAPSANATYAEVDGHVAVRTVGQLPLRGLGSGLVPLPALERGVAWKGMVPAEMLPRRVDPPAGFVAAANARVTPPGQGPLVSADNAPGYRMARITKVLASRPRHTAGDMRALQGDWWNGQAERLLPTLLAALGGAPFRDPTTEAVKAELERWQTDPVNAPDLAAPLVFEHWYLALAEDLFAERLGAPLWQRLLRYSYVLNHALDGLVLGPEAGSSSAWWDSREGSRADELRDVAMRTAFARAVAGLAREQEPSGPEAWRWGASHRITFPHELGKAVPLLGRWLDRGPYPWGGGNATVGRARSRYDVPDRVTGAATVRVVIEMTQPMTIWAVMPGGQSGHPSDRHYDDQIPLWLERGHDRLPARFEEAEGSRLFLRPMAAE